MKVIIYENPNKTIHLDNVNILQDFPTFIKITDNNGRTICEPKKSIINIEIQK